MNRVRFFSFSNAQAQFRNWFSRAASFLSPCDSVIGYAVSEGLTVTRF